jgi:hypothetical protein
MANSEIIGAGQDTARPAPKTESQLCPCCNLPLVYNDVFGFLFPNQSGEIVGDIFRCENEKCDYYQEFFHSFYADLEIRNGYPC